MSKTKAHTLYKLVTPTETRWYVDPDAASRNLQNMIDSGQVEKGEISKIMTFRLTREELAVAILNNEAWCQHSAVVEKKP